MLSPFDCFEDGYDPSSVLMDFLVIVFFLCRSTFSFLKNIKQMLLHPHGLVLFHFPAEHHDSNVRKF